MSSAIKTKKETEKDEMKGVEKQSWLNNFSTAVSQIVNGTPSEAEEKEVNTTPPTKAANNLTDIKLPAAEKKATPFAITNDAIKTISKTVLAKDVEINGNIKVGGDVELYGTVNGNIECDGNILVAGVVNGNVTAASAIVNLGKIKGESLKINASVTINVGSEVTANIFANSVEIDGTVIGDLEVADSTLLKSNAKVDGDISTKYVEMQKGTAVSGNLKVIDNA